MKITSVHVKSVLFETNPLIVFVLGSLGRTPCHDLLFGGWGNKSGPFASSKDFHDCLVLTSLKLVPFGADLAKSTREALPDNLPIVFAHNDLSNFENILISETGSEVVAIIDWELSGFYPAYQEWARLKWGEESKPTEVRFADRAMKPYPEMYRHWYEWLRFLC